MGLKLFHACLFYPVIFLIGTMNSFPMVDNGWYRSTFVISSFLLFLYFSLVVSVSKPRERLIFLIGMFVCAFGENLCVHALDLYHFAGAASPPYSIAPYVILGHGYTIWTALVLSEKSAERFGSERVLRACWMAVVMVTAARILRSKDYVGSVWFGFLIFSCIFSSNRAERLLFFTIYLLSTGLELMGVGIKAWDWHASTYYYNSEQFPFHSPPAGVGGFYVLADWATLRTLRIFKLEERPQD